MKTGVKTDERSSHAVEATIPALTLNIFHIRTEGGIGGRIG
jgi:hypothetical protein